MASSNKQDKAEALPFKVLSRVEIDGVLFTPDGGRRRDGVYTDPTGKVLAHWYFQALFTDGLIRPATEEEAAAVAADPAPAEEIAALMADATARNSANAEPLSAQVKADNEAAARASAQTSKALAKADAVQKAAAAKTGKKA